MQKPPEISFRDVEASDRRREKILQEIDKLERYFDRIIGCRVVVEVPHKHARHGNRYRVGIRLTVPTRELVVSRDPADEESHQDLDVAITDAFKAMRRQLEEYADQLRSQKRQGGAPERFGEVVRLMTEDGYGFIRTPDGRDVYFHEDTLVGHDLEDLGVQTPVRFSEEQGDKGPQARQVHVLKQGSVPSVEEG